MQQCRSPRTAEDDRDADSEPDDLDALTRHYQAEAEAAKARAEGAAKQVALQSKGMAELRSDGLATPLGSDTKYAPLQRICCPLYVPLEQCQTGRHRCRGFQMLAAMGYRPGTGIGRTVVGRAAPLDINLKADRTGLGVSEAKRRREQAAQQERQQRGAPCLAHQMTASRLQQRSVVAGMLVLSSSERAAADVGCVQRQRGNEALTTWAAASCMTAGNPSLNAGQKSICARPAWCALCARHVLLTSVVILLSRWRRAICGAAAPVPWVHVPACLSQCALYQLLFCAGVRDA